jgi:hypothetical protein
MRSYRLSLCVLFFAAVLLSQQRGIEQGSNVRDLGYVLVPDWPAPALSAAGAPAGPWNLIQAPGVAVDSRGHVLVLHRGAHPILEFESGGKFVRSWGDGMFSEGKVVAVPAKYRARGASGYSAVYGPAGCDSCGAHSVRVDPEGNIWAVDAPGHVIYKMNPEGKVILQLGQKGVPGMSPDNFNLPTDVAFAPKGEIYVSDGYGNPRVVKYTHEGKYLLQWGRGDRVQASSSYRTTSRSTARAESTSPIATTAESKSSIKTENSLTSGRRSAASRPSGSPAISTSGLAGSCGISTERRWENCLLMWGAPEAHMESPYPIRATFMSASSAAWRRSSSASEVLM